MAELSKQRKWQLDHKARGLCGKCSRPALPEMTHCQKHNEAVLANRRAKMKCKRRYRNTKMARALEAQQ